MGRPCQHVIQHLGDFAVTSRHMKTKNYYSISITKYLEDKEKKSKKGQKEQCKITILKF